MRMNSLLKRSFARNSPRFSFLTVSLYGTREREKKRPLSDVCQGAISNSFSILYIGNN